MAELKPCKCGQDRFIFHTAIGYKVICKCGHNTKGFYKTEEEAIDAWNKRS